MQTALALPADGPTPVTPGLGENEQPDPVRPDVPPDPLPPDPPIEPEVPAPSPAEVEEALPLDRADRRTIQEGLLAAGFNPGAADGLFGAGTRAALRQWQASRQAVATGYLDAPACGGASSGGGGGRGARGRPAAG